VGTRDANKKEEEKEINEGLDKHASAWYTQVMPL
jgi:hypothetical protein